MKGPILCELTSQRVPQEGCHCRACVWAADLIERFGVESPYVRAVVFGEWPHSRLPHSRVTDGDFIPKQPMPP